MAITRNKNTTQGPINSFGLTGSQVITLIDAPRVYVKAPDSLFGATPPSNFSGGTTPPGWLDLGVVEGKIKFEVKKTTKPVTTGMDGYLRTAYASDKTGKAEFTLAQFDTTVFEAITNLAPVVSESSEFDAIPGLFDSRTGLFDTSSSTLMDSETGLFDDHLGLFDSGGSGSASSCLFYTGSEEINILSILLVVQNKIDGKEWQFYNPSAFVNFAIEEYSDALCLKCFTVFPFFYAAGSSTEAFLNASLFTPSPNSILDSLGDVTLDSLGDVSLDSL